MLVKNHSAIQGIIFDLDDTLIDTSGLLLPHVGTPKYFDLINAPLPLIDGARENLEYLMGKYQLYLVTQGNPAIQKQKMTSAALAPFFNEVIFVNSHIGESKQSAFKLIIDRFRFNPSEVLSVGNRRSTDIRPARQLNMATCLFLYGEHLHELPEGPDDEADVEINHHRDLIKACRL